MRKKTIHRNRNPLNIKKNLYPWSLEYTLTTPKFDNIGSLGVVCGALWTTLQRGTKTLIQFRILVHNNNFLGHFDRKTRILLKWTKILFWAFFNLLKIHWNTHGGHMGWFWRASPLLLPSLTTPEILYASESEFDRFECFLIGY